MTQSLLEAAIEVLSFFDGEQPPMRAAVLAKLREAVWYATPLPRPPLENPYHATRAADDLLP